MSDGDDKIANQLREELWRGGDPFEYAELRFWDTGYPDSVLPREFVETVLGTFSPRFWLEIGCSFGESTIKTADAIKAIEASTEMCCIDHFCGDEDMWVSEKEDARTSRWRCLNLLRGRPTLYDRFLANVKAASHGDIVVPVLSTAEVGINVLRRLAEDGRIAQFPDAVLFSSQATSAEMHLAWEALAGGHIMMGCDWNAVKDTDFFRSIAPDASRAGEAQRKIDGGSMEGGIFVYGTMWLVVK